jgi:hypothetical protein
MKLDPATVLITGAHRGPGPACAAARDPSRVALPGVVPIPLDPALPGDIAPAVHARGGVTLPLDKAGIAASRGMPEGDAAAAKKPAPDAVVRTRFDALQAGACEVRAGKTQRQGHAGLWADRAVHLQAIGR